MNPAPSIVFFTTASGAGYGILFWLGLLRPAGLLPAAPAFAMVALVLALLLVTAGLLASLTHLGNPQRAWRALSQWRSSWLSREGVAAALTYVPAVGFGLALLAGQPGIAALAGLLMAAGAAATVYCTAMIYASLKPIREWNNSLVMPGYLLFAGYSGMALLAAICGLGGIIDPAAAFTINLAVVAGLLKMMYWRMLEVGRPVTTLESATGITGLGKVRPLDPPHTETNYLLREMGYRVARKHAATLRRVVIIAGFVAPVVLSGLAIALGAGGVASAALILGAVSVLVGLLAERWLMFAEATHTVTLYYSGE